MNKNIILNKYYRNLRQNIFNKLDIKEFTEVYIKFKRLNIQYKFLKIANFLEKITIFKSEIPILRFLTMLLDFIHWKLYDLIMFLINGRVFNLYGVTCYCGRQR